MMNLKKENVQDGEDAFSLLRGWFNEEKEEYDNGFIPPAVNLSVNDINKETASKIAPDVAKPIIIYCRTGRRTKDAAKKLVALGYYYVLDMGGIMNWPYSITYP